MNAFESLFSSSGTLFGHLRAMIAMPASHDTSGPSPGPTLQPPASAPELDGPASSSQCTDASTSSPPRRKRTTPRKRKIPRLHRPDEGSIYDIMHDNSGKSLYVLPICWTDLHATLLGASFTEGAPIVTPVPEAVAGRWLDPSLLARQLTDQLHALIRSETSMTRIFYKNMAMKTAIGIFFPDRLADPKMNAELDIYFGQRVFRKAVRIPCLWKTPNATSFTTIPTLPNDSFYVPNSPEEPQPELPQQTSNTPILAYINKSQLALIRQNLFRIVQTPFNPNEAVASLQALRSKHLIPADVDQDPYIVAMMVSMAQAHFYQEVFYSQKSDSQQSNRSGNGKPFEIAEPKFEDTKVAVIAHDEGIENNPRFLVYTATVTADYLERWLYPLKVPQSSKKAKKEINLDITMTPVPFWPILGLKERLARALGKDIVGPDVYSDSHPDHIGFWDLLVEPRKDNANKNTPPKNESNSRKRRAERQGGRESQSSQSQVSQGGYISQGSATSSQSQRAESSESDSQREPLSEVYNSSFEEEAPTESDTTTSPTRSETDRADRTAANRAPDRGDRECPVLSPNTKRRRTARSISAVEVR
ncbi:hypothetical protein QBC32DRAFT_70282 [Pseudoneurospora amorphoporcata]|uniref:Uncharacterized protein n=1 Tax=Pseudoneurospora amorphoporcata TaxID=241081 RepID=A0AAN6NMS0_9PEZI|nr:hypothetical protein QBC32DRAFT_70282 [Pseudoneurospora amorphoporcata]